jgi:hypothetical protein
VQKPLNHWGEPSGGREHIPRSQALPGNAAPEAPLQEMRFDTQELGCSFGKRSFKKSHSQAELGNELYGELNILAQGNSQGR